MTRLQDLLPTLILSGFFTDFYLISLLPVWDSLTLSEVVGQEVPRHSDLTMYFRAADRDNSKIKNYKDGSDVIVVPSNPLYRTGRVNSFVKLVTIGLLNDGLNPAMSRSE